MWPKILVVAILFLVQVSCEHKSSLTFVIDDTRSMNDEVSQIKNGAKSIVDIALNEIGSQIEDLVLVTFNDPGVKFWKRTRNAGEFKQALDQVFVHDGLCAEKSLTGIKLALEESLPGSYLFVFTDAGSNDLHLLDEVISLCQEKQSQIVFVLTGDICQTTGVYSKIARASNGQVFEISKEEIAQVLEYIKETVKSDRSMTSIQAFPPKQLTKVSFTIDNKTEFAIVSASGKNFTLKVMDSYNRDISGYTRIIWTENIKVLKLANLRPGTYVAQVYGSTNANTKVTVFARADSTHLNMASLTNKSTL